MSKRSKRHIKRTDLKVKTNQPKPIESITGLTTAEVAERVADGRDNRYLPKTSRSYPAIIFATIVNPYNLILISSILLLLALRGFGGSFFAGGLVFVNIAIGLFQEIRAKRALDRLHALNVKTATVRRNNHSESVLLRNLVLDDIVELNPGESIPADGILIASDSFEVDESLLTGESGSEPKEIGESLLSGSFCTAGKGLMRITKIGKDSYAMQLTVQARIFKNSRSPFERTFQAVLQYLMITSVVVAPAILLFGRLQNLEIATSLENVINAIASLVPQGLILNVTILFTMGAIRISRFETLIQRLNTIESMGHLNLICTDKTGTLTYNKLTLENIITLGGVSKKDIETMLNRYISAVSTVNNTLTAISTAISHIKVTALKTHEVPFTSSRKWGAVGFEDVSIIIGSPETVLTQPDNKLRAIKLAREGFRVIALSQTLHTISETLPDARNDLALITLKDEVRPDIAATLAEFTKLGIGIKIISGDSAETVLSVATASGIKNPLLITESKLVLLDDKKFLQTVKKYTLFARITPETKRRIIETLTKSGYHTGMIGDGVNDVPALKQANIAIAMNGGASITKDVSDMILLNNSFSVLPKAITEGKDVTNRIYGVTKIYFTKIVFLTTLFILTGILSLPFPATIPQTTLLGFIFTGLPIPLIAFALIKPATISNFKRESVLAGIVYGLIGGLTATVIPILFVAFYDSTAEVMRTAIMIFSAGYLLYIFADVLGLSLLQPLTSYAKKREFGAWAVSAILFFILFFGLASFFSVSRLTGEQWRIIGFLLVGSILCSRISQTEFINPYIERAASAAAKLPQKGRAKAAQLTAKTHSSEDSR